MTVQNCVSDIYITIYKYSNMLLYVRVLDILHRTYTQFVMK